MTDRSNNARLLICPRCKEKFYDLTYGKCLACGYKKKAFVSRLTSKSHALATYWIAFALVLTVCSIHLPWIYDEHIGGDYFERVENWFWPFMKRSVFHRTNYPTVLRHELFDQLWRYGSDTLPGPDYVLKILVAGSVSDPTEGYFVIFFFQLLTVLFQAVCCIVADRWDAPVLQLIFYVATFVLSVVPPVVGVNQYVLNWRLVGTDLVQFSAGFYLSVLSSILTLIYVLGFITKILRE